jgi:cytochrome c oxidase cbb3-type subunit 3
VKTYLIVLVAFACIVNAQAPGRRSRPGGNSAAFPQRPPADAAALQRGKALYGVNCNFCHGSDARGGEGGPNLLRSQLVLEDQTGDKIGPVIKNGRPEAGMPKFDMTPAQIADVAVYIHAFPVNNRDPARFPPPSILTGDAKAGGAYFAAKCTSCHSVTGDMKGISSRITEPKTLQNAIVMPGGRGVPAMTVTVTLPSGQKTEGKLVRIDDFTVNLVTADGIPHTFRRDGDTPKLEIRDPLQGHRDLLGIYTDKDIHNLTAYLVTLK